MFQIISLLLSTVICFKPAFTQATLHIISSCPHTSASVKGRIKSKAFLLAPRLK
jgi:hypothetical protein